MVKTSRPAQHNSSNGWEFSGGSKEISYLWYKIALSTALILIGLGIYWMDPAFFPRAFSLSVRGDIQGTVEYLRSFGVKAAWVSLLLLTIINMLGFLPNIFLIVANGFLFGIVPGILISWAGECDIFSRTRHENCWRKADMQKKSKNLAAAMGWA